MYNFEKINNSILTDKKVFKPNLTSKLSFNVACKKIRNNSEVLDLGCGNGIIGIGILKNKKELNCHVQILVIQLINLLKKYEQI